MTNWAIFKKILFLFIGWRIVLIILTFYGVSLLPTPDRNNNGFHKPSSENYWAHWANWDSAHLLNVAGSGYILGRTPFFPLYPILILLISLTGISLFWSGFIVTQIASIFALFFLYKLVLLDFGDETANKTTTLLLIFPTSFYLGALYSESLFLVLSVAAFYFARKKNWLLASILAGFSSVTRLVGIAVIISIFAEYFFTRVPKFKIRHLYDSYLKRLVIYLFAFKLFLNLFINLKLLGYGVGAGIVFSISIYLNLLIWIFFAGLILFNFFKFFDFQRVLNINTFYLLLSLIPLTSFMLFLYSQFNNPVAFLKGHEYWGRHITLPLTTILNHFSIMLPNLLKTGFKNQFQLEFASLIMLLVLFYLGLKKLRFSYITYFALSILIPLASGKLTSMPRIALVVFPMFIVIALIKNEAFHKIWIFGSLLMLSILTVLYFNSFWVA